MEEKLNERELDDPGGWDNNSLFYLIIGTGKAWAWHNKLIVEPMALTKMLPFESELNTGALKPTGSVDRNHFFEFRKKRSHNRLRKKVRKAKTQEKDRHLPKNRSRIALSRAQNRNRLSIADTHWSSVNRRQLGWSWWYWFWEIENVQVNLSNSHFFYIFYATLKAIWDIWAELWKLCTWSLALDNPEQGR